MKGFLVLFAILACCIAQKADYTGYTIQRCPLKGEELPDLLRGILSAFNVDVLAEGVDFVDVIVQPQQRELFLGLHCEVTVEDLQTAIEEEERDLAISRSFLDARNDSYYETYHTYEEVVAKLDMIARNYPQVVSKSSYGRSLEGRDLPLMRIKGNNPKKSIYINGGIHAREWISTPTVVYLIENLASRYGKDAQVTRILDQVEFYIAPTSNPDGFTYTWTNDRMWRKNRNPNSGASCMGVDLNRNFDVYWSTGSSNNKCAQDYHGESAASEPEVLAIQKLVESMPNIIGAIDVHAYGQYIMRPYGWTYQLHPQETTLKRLGDAVAATIKQTTGTTYSSIRSAELYPVSGASDDWFTVKRGLWGFCFELRDNGRYGFRLPENQILPTATEIFAGILTYSEFVLENFA